MTGAPLVGANGRLFICHASRDVELAQLLCGQLESMGRRCWMAPRDVEEGQPYAGQLVRAIASCDVFIILVTAHSVESHHVLRELEQATRYRRNVLPVIVDGARSDDLDYYLGAVHQVVGSPDEVVHSLTSYFTQPPETSRSSPSVRGELPSRLTVGVIPFPPFASHGAGRPDGFYMRLLDRFASETGTPVSFVPITNDKTVSGLEQGDLDVVACLYRSPRRMSRFQFAACFYAASVTAVVRTGDTKVRTQKDLLREDVRIATCRGEVGSELAQDSFQAPAGSERLIEVDTVDVKMIAGMVVAGMADVAITDSVTCQLITQASRGLLEEVFVRRPLFVGHIGLVLPRAATGLAAHLDLELSRIRASEEMQQYETEMLEDYPDLVELL